MTQSVSFGRYHFEPQTVRLWVVDSPPVLSSRPRCPSLTATERSDRGEVKLTPKAAAVLGVLIERAGQPVTKQELFASVWSNTIVSDDALATCVQELRKALGDDSRQPQYIETRHRVGYRFVAELGAAVPMAGHGVPKAESGVPTAEFGVPTVAPGVPIAGRLAAVAVLPFVDMSPNRDQDYFCEGLAEELIDALTHVDGLRVAARSSSFQFRGAGLDVRQVGRSLGVDALLEGSVRKADDRLRITVQLVDAASGYHRWSQRFDRTLGDVFAIQDEIAEAVASTLRGGELSRREKSAVRRLQTAAEPYEYYLRARQRMHRMQQPDMDQSRQMFERAIELDTGYAPAWAGLATVHALLFEWWGAKDEDLQRADKTSRIAMELAPDLADAHVARGFALSLHRHYNEAEVHFEAAARINPHLFDAFYYYGRACFARGQVERSADLFRKASEVRQEDFQSVLLGSQSLRMLGRGEDARATNREGVARVERTLALNPLDGRALALGSLALFESGDIERAMEMSRRSLDLYPDDMSALLNAACLRCRAGMKEEAMDIVERVFGRGWGKRDWVDHDPDYDILRDDPRFQRVLAKLK
jgi:adenylate cyclase